VNTSPQQLWDPVHHSRMFDLIVWGATGYTGRLVSKYLALTYPELNWAIAGRSQAKLSEQARQLAVIRAKSVEYRVGDASDQASVDEVVSQTRVVIACAGPFSQFGSPVVDACVRLGKHYVDITGESWWVRKMIKQYQELAQKNHALIVNICGLESIPSDLGVLMMVDYIKENLNAETGKVLCVIDGPFQPSGGTLATLATSSSSAARDFNPSDANSLILETSPGLPLAPKPSWSTFFQKLPRYDPESGTYSSFWIMEVTDSKVVMRSHALRFSKDSRTNGYGKNFSYEIRKKESSLIMAWISFLTMSLFFFILQIPFLFKPLSRVLPKQGEGPSEELLKNGWFKCDLYATVGDGQRRGEVIKGEIRGKEPGYYETSRMVTEAALCLLDSEALPKTGGFYTPSSCFGPALLKRFKQHGPQFQVMDPKSAQD